MLANKAAEVIGVSSPGSVEGRQMPSQVERRQPPVRDILRAHTRHLHEGLHQHSSFEGLLDGSLSLQGYRQLIRRLYGFYAPLDRAIGEAVADEAMTCPCFQHVSRSDLLAQDMLDLGYTEGEVAGTRLCPRAFGLVMPSRARRRDGFWCRCFMMKINGCIFPETKPCAAHSPPESH